MLASLSVCLCVCVRNGFILAEHAETFSVFLCCLRKRRQLGLLGGLGLLEAGF